MNWRMHILCTVLLSIAFVGIVTHYFNAKLGFEESLIFILIGGASALIPDIDEPNSKISRIAFPLAVVAVCAFVFGLLGVNTPSIMLTILSLLFVYAVYKFIVKRHRGNTHSWMFAFLFALPVYVYFGLLTAGAVLFGYTMHLCQDKVADTTGFGR
jgi:membrane-bound metal-dependent hydrolase YbcI (DUF457 family)